MAIVYAAQVDGKLAGGDYHGAVQASNNAKMWSWISFGASVAVGVLYFMLISYAVLRNLPWYPFNLLAPG